MYKLLNPHSYAMIVEFIKMKKLILLSSLFLFSVSAYCEIYKWTDTGGKIRYGDSQLESMGSKTLGA